MTNFPVLVLIAFLSLSVTSCAEMQVKRDLQVANDSSQYKKAVALAADEITANACTHAPKLKSWLQMPFTSATRIYKLPNGISAAAYCVKVPQNAKAVELYAGASSGMSYHEISLAHPSFISITQDFKLLKDVQVPRMSPREGWTEFRISGITLLGDTLEMPTYLIIYVHPESVNGRVDVLGPGATIPVPYSPYGNVKARFHAGT